MKTTFFAICLLAWFPGAARAETIEMTAGPDVVLSYDPVAWKPLAPLGKPELGMFQTVTWAFQNPEWVQITVADHPEPKKDAEFKREALEMQKFRGDAAELVRERRESLAGRDWLVLEFRNPNTRPARSEIHYFLPGAHGYTALFVVCEERNLAKQSEAIAAFVGGLQLK